MKDEQDYIKDIAEMRSMMERSSKFLSLSGLSGIMAGVYAIVGAFIVFRLYDYKSEVIGYGSFSGISSAGFPKVIFTGCTVLLLTIATALLLSYKKANKRGEKLWNATAKRLVINLAVPLFTGAVLMLIFIFKGLIGFVAPFTLLFYGLALYSASKFTYEEMRSLGLIEIVLGLLSIYLLEYSLWFWAVGFGIVHIIYGIYMHHRYER